MTNKEFIEEFKKQAISIVDDIEHYPDDRGSSDGEFIIYYKGTIFGIQYYIYNNELCIDCDVTGLIYKGETITDESIIDWHYDDSEKGYSNISELVENLLTEMISCDIKKSFRKVSLILDSIKEDLSEEEYEIFKTLISYEL